MATAREHLTTILDFAQELAKLDDQTLEHVGYYIEEADDALTDAMNTAVQEQNAI
jgi:hypothetical protein